MEDYKRVCTPSGIISQNKVPSGVDDEVSVLGPVDRACWHY